MRVVAAAVFALFVLTSPLAWAAAHSDEELPWHSAYADVPTDHWAYRAIESFRELGALDLWPEDYFSGERVLTRYEFAQALRCIFDCMHPENCDTRTDALLWALEVEFYDQLSEINPVVFWIGLEPDYDRDISPGSESYEGVPGSAYADVPTDHWAYRAIESFGDLGALDGYPEGFFGGERLLTRYEFAQAMVRLSHEMRERRSDARTIALMWALDGEFGAELQELSDGVTWSEDVPDYWPGHVIPAPPPRCEEEVPPDHWADASMERFGELGALARYPDDYFSGDQPLTRGQFAKVVQHLFDWFRRHGWDEEIDFLLTALETEFYDQLSVDCEVALWSE